MLNPTDILEDVEEVLRNAPWGKGAGPRYFTPFQILARLPQRLRDQLIGERGMPGRGSDSRAVRVVQQACQMLSRRGVAVSSDMGLATPGVRFLIDGRSVEPGYEVCKLYRFNSDPAR